MGGLKETRQTDGVDGEESEDICENNKIPELWNDLSHNCYLLFFKRYGTKTHNILAQNEDYLLKIPCTQQPLKFIWFVLVTMQQIIHF